MKSVPHRRPVVTALVTAVARLAMTFIASIECARMEIKPEKGKGVIIVANHASLLDLLVGLEVFHRWKIAPYVFIRADYLQLPIVGWLFRGIGSIPAGRDYGVVAIRHGVRVLRDGGIVMIMPEGGIPKPLDSAKELRDLMPGTAHLAAGLGTPILVAGIANTEAAWPPGSPFPHFHFRRSRRPKIVISANWLEVAKASPEPKIMAAMESELASILHKLRSDHNFQLGGFMSWSRFVAIGDSFTEGLNDSYPDGISFRGWADLVAEKLAIEYEAKKKRELTPPDGRKHEKSSGFLYANLAIRGRRFSQVVAEQVPVALEMVPDLVSFTAGGNDLLLPKLDIEKMLRRFGQVIADFHAISADVIIFALPDVTERFPRHERTYRRLEQFNAEMKHLAVRNKVTLVDMWSDESFKNHLLWSQDRLHLTPSGHRLVAAMTLRELGVAPDPNWLEPLDPAPVKSWAAGRIDDWQWMRRYYFPWLKRRLTGRSTGDGLAAKRPALDPWPPYI